MSTAREELPFHVDFYTLIYPGDTYLDRWETLDALIRTQSLVFIGIAVDCVEWEKGVETESSLAVLWYHTLTMLAPEDENALNHRLITATHPTPGGDERDHTRLLSHLQHQFLER